jgi:drug/metabolite transporter (DMT)-like permease
METNTAEGAQSDRTYHPRMPDDGAHGPSSAKIWTGLVTVYFFWGTTYLAIDRSNQTIPPLVGPAIRFLVAGTVLMALSRARGGWRRPHRREWMGAAVVGVLLLFGGNALVATAEDLGVPTGVMALIIAMVPLWIALIDRVVLRSAPMGWRVVVGLAGGFAGAALLVAGQLEGDVRPLGLAVAVIASLSWSSGSLASREVPLPQDALQASGMQQVAGGVAILIAATASGQLGDLDVSKVSAVSLLALLYLIVIGSLVTFSTYLWLLRNARTSLVSTYAYVNPVVAVTLGWIVLDEVVTARTLIAGGVILVAVALIVSAGGAARSRRAELVETAEAEAH